MRMNNRIKKILIIILFFIILTLTVFGIWQVFVSYFNNKVLIPLATSQDIIKDLRSKIEKQDQAITKLCQEVQQQSFINTTSLNIMMVQYLISSADLALSTTQNTKTAIALLLAAKKYCINNESLSPIVGFLNQNIETLQSTTVLDTEAIIAKLELLNQQLNQQMVNLGVVSNKIIIRKSIRKSKLSSAHCKHQNLQVTGEKGSLNNQLKALVSNIFISLKQLVAIRYQPTQALPLAMQTMLTCFNIQVKLTQAVFAVMNRQDRLYQSLLSQAIDLIQKNFEINNPQIIALLKEIGELQKVNICPSIPNIKDTLAAINNLSNPYK